MGQVYPGKPAGLRRIFNLPINITPPHLHYITFSRKKERHIFIYISFSRERNKCDGWVLSCDLAVSFFFSLITFTFTFTFTRSPKIPRNKLLKKNYIHPSISPQISKPTFSFSFSKSNLFFSKHHTISSIVRCLISSNEEQLFQSSLLCFSPCSVYILSTTSFLFLRSCHRRRRCWWWWVSTSYQR